MGAAVRAIWQQLSDYDGCPFCGHVVPLNTFPWRYDRHDVHGNPVRYNIGGIETTVCVGSRSVFTLEFLDLTIPKVAGD